MEYCLYKKPSLDSGTSEGCDIKISQFVPKPWRAAIPNEKISLKTYLVRVSFWLATAGKAKIFYVMDDSNEVVHTSYLIPRCGKFAFMNKGDWEIGPCETKEKFRGRGIYPKVINYIISSYSNNNAVFYMIVAKNNAPSIRGIEKAGFEKCGTVIKTKFMKRYCKKHTEDDTNE